MKTASFTVRADVRQSARWKQAAEGEGFPSVGAWLAGAADAYLKVRARAGIPVPLAWRRGRFRVELQEGTVEVSGHVSPPFGQFYGTPAGIPRYSGAHLHSLVYVPTGRILATVRTRRECKALAAELARLWVRGDGSEPSGNPAPVLP
ncbi:MAG TPA: hypothetical protein VJ725_23065 [Thermoanaerobaculia bacterium]|nr:hypothetical protein [Thermoanaerobaculia bacterium]